MCAYVRLCSFQPGPLKTSQVFTYFVIRPYILPNPALSFIISVFIAVSASTIFRTIICNADYCRAAVVTESRLWIHGGEIGLWNCTGDGFTYDRADINGNYSYLPSKFHHLTSQSRGEFDRSDNDTFWIDLSSSWNNASFPANTVGRAKAPALTKQALWVDPDESSFYAYAGVPSASRFYPVPGEPPNQLWQFTPSRDSGDWSLVAPPASTNFSDLTRSYGGAYTYGGGLGFALGGFKAYNEWDATPGLVMYNFTSQSWYNISASGYGQDEVSIDGAAHFVPSFGPAGLLFILGGGIGHGILPGMDEIYMFDPTSQRWSSQKVSGTKPSPATLPCTIGAQGDNNTYEVRTMWQDCVLSFGILIRCYIDFLLRRHQHIRGRHNEEWRSLRSLTTSIPLAKTKRYVSIRSLGT